MAVTWNGDAYHSLTILYHNHEPQTTLLLIWSGEMLANWPHIRSWHLMSWNSSICFQISEKWPCRKFDTIWLCIINKLMQSLQSFANTWFLFIHHRNSYISLLQFTGIDPIWILIWPINKFSANRCGGPIIPLGIRMHQEIGHNWLIEVTKYQTKSCCLISMPYHVLFSSGIWHNPQSSLILDYSKFYLFFP